MGESTSKFDFERIVPVFCANRPVQFLRESSRSNRPREELVFARNVPWQTNNFLSLALTIRDNLTHYLF